MKPFLLSPFLLSLSQFIGLVLGAWIQYQILKQIGMVTPIAVMVFFCFVHQYFLRKRDSLPRMPLEIKQYLKIAALWGFFVLLSYSFSQLDRLKEIWIVLPILFLGTLVMDLVILLCCQEVVGMIIPKPKEIE